MIVEKNGKSFTVKENAKSWSVQRMAEAVQIRYSVPKDLCSTEAQLRDYIAASDLF